jgi:hypothetical protein
MANCRRIEAPSAEGGQQPLIRSTNLFLFQTFSSSSWLQLRVPISNERSTKAMRLTFCVSMAGMSGASPLSSRQHQPMPFCSPQARSLEGRVVQFTLKRSIQVYDCRQPGLILRMLLLGILSVRAYDSIQRASQ